VHLASVAKIEDDSINKHSSKLKGEALKCQTQHIQTARGKAKNDTANKEII
jgi:hypothetical protein